MQPTLQQQKDFLFQTYFGTRGDELDRFISSAYLDMNRTLRGIGKLVKNRPCAKWLTWDDQKAYQAFQDTLRQTAAKQSQSPLDLEYSWWLEYRSQVTGDGA